MSTAIAPAMLVPGCRATTSSQANTSWQLVRACRRYRLPTFNHRSCVLSLPIPAGQPCLPHAEWRTSAQNADTADSHVTTLDGNGTDWTPLDEIIWEGTEAEAMARSTDPDGHHSWASMSPPWKVMILSDGSVTRHLQLLTNLVVDVDCIEMKDIGSCFEGLPEGAELFPGSVVQRQVYLREGNKSKQAHVYAASWWNADEVNRYLANTEKPIWVSLSEGRTELYRDIKRLYYGNSATLEREFGVPGPFWARHYIFWHNQKPLTMIYEVFCNSLEAYLGPASLVMSSEDPLSSLDGERC